MGGDALPFSALIGEDIRPTFGGVDLLTLCVRSGSRPYTSHNGSIGIDHPNFHIADFRAAEFDFLRVFERLSARYYFPIHCIDRGPCVRNRVPGRPFDKGKSGNPKGRPRKTGSSFSSCLTDGTAVRAFVGCFHWS